MTENKSSKKRKITKTKQDIVIDIRNKKNIKTENIIKSISQPNPSESELRALIYFDDLKYDCNDIFFFQ